MATPIVAPGGATPAIASAEGVTKKAALNENERVVVQTIAQMAETALLLPCAGELDINAVGLLYAARDWIDDKHWEGGDVSLHRAEASLRGALALDEHHSPESEARHDLIRKAADLADATALSYSATLVDGYIAAVSIRAVQALATAQAFARQAASHGGDPIIFMD